ncbi:MAG TPA: peptidoglycan DD-metalloendopeptidase family protein [Aquabacterium sp.]|nr:peptidoglycan DD-metalloendopeptidase family protein [Aquabacterium sp.]
MLERMPLLLVMLVVLLAGCASSKNRAPVEERAAALRPPAASAEAAPAPVPPAAEAKPMLNAEHAGKPGYYTVKQGDTLIRIGLENGQNWRDVARWNGIENPNLIEVGQVLRVLPPSADPNAVASRAVAPTKVEARPLDAKPPVAGASAPATGSPAGASAASAPSAAAAKDPDDDLGWLWPASGPVTAGFEEGRSKGVAIAGKAGDPVLAAADGRVVYAGSGLRGYGNLVIVKHNNTYLTAYAHNQTLLVKEDQVVRRGQRIAEMGSSDADRVQLHFEIRKQGKPVDPQRLLPPR